ncbi:GNAT family N-acetyltransferase [Halobacillus andaensis]|uniref:GNAT family N-acetyltransferase n=1 Tax=Halobacillus andaensis TaxID=1176239 RepID=UPI003D74E932
MIRLLNHRNSQTAKEMLTVQAAAYKVEARLIRSNKIPRLYDTVKDIQLSDETFVGYRESNVLTGFVSYKAANTDIEIHRLVVAPAHFKKGIGKALIGHLFSLSPQKITVSTGTENKPAVQLYQSLGFKEGRKMEVAPGLWLTEFIYI